MVELDGRQTYTHTHRPARRQSKPRHKVRNILKLPQWHDMNSNNSVELTHSVCVRVSASFKLILTVNKFIYNWISFASEWDAVNGSNVSLQKCIMFSCDRVAHVCHSSTAKMSRCAQRFLFFFLFVGELLNYIRNENCTAYTRRLNCMRDRYYSFVRFVDLHKKCRMSPIKITVSMKFKANKLC